MLIVQVDRYPKEPVPPVKILQIRNPGWQKFLKYASVVFEIILVIDLYYLDDQYHLVKLL